MQNQKKRTAFSVQDVVNGRNETAGSTKFKSGYTGPKKTSSRVMERINAENARKSADVSQNFSEKRFDSHSSGYSPLPSKMPSRRYGGGSAPQRSYVAPRAGGGIFEFAWIAYVAILVIALSVSIILYSTLSHSAGGYRYPSLWTMNGVLNAIYEDYQNGGLGSGLQRAALEEAAAKEEEQQQADTSGLLGDTSGTSSMPNSTTGATMALDTGSTYGDYGMAGSYEELITQLGQALQANDFGFVGMKLAYEDEETGNLIGYPQSVVEHFTQYMCDNTGKREVFMSEIKDEDRFFAKNGSAYIVKLPLLRFTINMGYDGANVSVSGFSDKKMDSGQSAVVSPLLPCMYTVTVSTDGGSKTSEVECNMGEGNLQINIGVTN